MSTTVKQRLLSCLTLAVLVGWGGVALAWTEPGTTTKGVQPISPLGQPTPSSNPLEAIDPEPSSRGGPEIPEPLTVSLVATGVAVLLGRQSLRQQQ